MEKTHASTHGKPGWLRVIASLVAAMLCLALAACGGTAGTTQSTSMKDTTSQETATVVENGSYTSKDDVAAYIHEFGHLPGNFISKTKARKAGWVPSKGNLDEACPGKSIGGSRYYNDDGALPDARGRTWTECDIGYEGGFRGSERIVFSDDGLIFYTGDHYKTFEQLY